MHVVGTSRGLAVCGLWTTVQIPTFPHHVSHYDDVMKWKHFPRYWPFVWGIHRSPVNSPHKGQWRGALMFSMICTRMNAWVNNRKAGDLRRYQAHYDVTLMIVHCSLSIIQYKWGLPQYIFIFVSVNHTVNNTSHLEVISPISLTAL